MTQPTDRESARRAFAVSYIGEAATFTPLGGDASYRSYYRCQTNGASYILMDAPVAAGGIDLFVQRAQQFAACGLPVPHIHAADSAQGFLLLDDFGDRWLWQDLRKNAAATLPQALTLLGQWQQVTATLQADIPPYEPSRLHTEVALTREWFLPWLNIAVDTARWQESENWLVKRAGQGRALCVHRDYHCRNLMRRADGSIGILDFQDALWGSPAYDLVSLTRDCYIRYPQADVRRWEADFRARYLPQESAEDWAQTCDAVSLQRHLKVLGLFVRLAERDGKRGYLADLPLVLAYTCDEAAALPHTAWMAEELRRAIPRLQEKLT